ncbi:unnamed protein product [Allacma fusca]|uniref:Uncharacterized protein n=1 Tax=Allacma fusca TaxID=39272 RepID=A0A8J2PVG3_9HEXA|nr:unnamed protein product [Allacma fusca]
MKPSKSKAGSKTLYLPQSNGNQTGNSSAAGAMCCIQGASICPPSGGFKCCAQSVNPCGPSSGTLGSGVTSGSQTDMLAGLRTQDPTDASNSQLKVDTLYNSNNMGPASSFPDMNNSQGQGQGQALGTLPPKCQADPLIQCIAGLISNILPDGGGQGSNCRGRRVTKDIYVGIPCNADRCCIDKFLGKPGYGCCPPSCAQKCCPPCGGGGCGGGTCGTGCCGGSCGKRYRRRGKSQKSQQPQENNNNVVAAGVGPGPLYKDGGNYAQMTDAAVHAQMGHGGPPQRNVITGMMSRTMIGNIEDLNVPVEEVVETPPVLSPLPATPPPRPKVNYKGPRLTRFVIPNDNEDDRSTRLDSRRDPGKSRPSTSRGFTNFRDDNEGADKKRGKVLPFRSTFD